MNPELNIDNQSWEFFPRQVLQLPRLWGNWASPKIAFFTMDLNIFKAAGLEDMKFNSDYLEVVLELGFVWFFVSSPLLWWFLSLSLPRNTTSSFPVKAYDLNFNCCKHFIATTVIDLHNTWKKAEWIFCPNDECSRMRISIIKASKKSQVVSSSWIPHDYCEVVWEKVNFFLNLLVFRRSVKLWVLRVVVYPPKSQ